MWELQQSCLNASCALTGQWALFQHLPRIDRAMGTLTASSSKKTVQLGLSFFYAVWQLVARCARVISFCLGRWPPQRRSFQNDDHNKSTKKRSTVLRFGLIVVGCFARFDCCLAIKYRMVRTYCCNEMMLSLYHCDENQFFIFGSSKVLRGA